MDLVELSMMNRQNQVLQSVGIAMLGQQFDLIEQAGEQFAASIAASSPSLEALALPNMGTQIDMTI